MKVRATRTLSGEYGTVRRGELFDLAEAQAKQLLRRGYVEQVMTKVSELKKPARGSAAA